MNMYDDDFASDGMEYADDEANISYWHQRLGMEHKLIVVDARYCGLSCFIL